MQLDSHLLPVNIILIFFRNLGEFIEIWEDLLKFGRIYGDFSPPPKESE